MGPSVIINPYGRRTAQVPPGEEGLTAGKVYPLSGLSIYPRIGDLPLLLIGVILGVTAMFVRRQP